jgi:hypothetical protein
LDKDGAETGQALLTREFARLLASVLADAAGDRSNNSSRHAAPLPVALVDERYTSKAAEIALSFKHAKKRFAGQVDSEAAGIILSDFFEGGGASRLDFEGARARAGTRPARQRVKELAGYRAGRPFYAEDEEDDGGAHAGKDEAAPLFEVVPPEPGLVAATEAADQEAADLDEFEARRKAAGAAFEVELGAAMAGGGEAAAAATARQNSKKRRRSTGQRSRRADFASEDDGLNGDNDGVRR